MKLSLHWAFLSIAARSVLAAIPLSVIGTETSLPIVPNRYIIEVEDLSEFERKRSAYTTPHEAVYETLQARGVSFDIVKEYDVPGIFVGTSLNLRDSEDVHALMQISQIRAIRPVYMIPPPKPLNTRILADPNDAETPSDSVHLMTAVDKVHAEGNKGKGVKIGIIDTGVDYNHPALGGGYGKGFKIVGGYDFVGDNYTGYNERTPDFDPLDECNGHGTHVAGIIGANPDNDFNITGVAPEAELITYRVFGCAGSVSDDIIIDALLTGFRDGLDILNLSLGSPFGWTTSAIAVVASRIAESGIIMCIAAGNDGLVGPWYGASPASAIKAFTVASLDNTIALSQPAIIEGGERDGQIVKYFNAYKLNITEVLPIFPISNDTSVEDDACEELPKDFPDLTPYLVLVRRGGCTFAEKMDIIAKKGAKASLIYDNGAGVVSFSGAPFEVAFIRGEDGEFLVNQFVAGEKLSLSFPQEGGPIIEHNGEGGLISNFSSFGPTNDFYFKPSLAAPGGAILSTIPLKLGKFAIQSGTSMASPFMAGSAALYLSAKGKSADVARGARNAFQSTGQRILSSHDEKSSLQTLAQQGTGLIDVYRAIHTNTTVSKVELVLNDTSNFVDVQTFTVTNTGSKSQTYKLIHHPAGTALTVKENSTVVATSPVPLTKTAIGLNLTPSSFTLRAGQSTQVTAKFKLPKNVDPARYPLYSGFIEAKSKTDSVHVAYIGLGASLREKALLDDDKDFFNATLPLMLNATDEPQIEPTNYTYVKEDFYKIAFRLAFGTPLIRFELVEPDYEIHSSAQVVKRGNGHIFTFPRPMPSNSLTPSKIIGPIFEWGYLGRNDESPYINGYSVLAFNAPVLWDGKLIPNGMYRMLLSVLRVTGDPDNDADYEKWLSPVFGIDLDLTPPEDPENPEEPDPEEPTDPEPEPEDP